MLKRVTPLSPPLAVAMWRVSTGWDLHRHKTVVKGEHKYMRIAPFVAELSRFIAACTGTAQVEVEGGGDGEGEATPVLLLLHEPGYLFVLPRLLELQHCQPGVSVLCNPLDDSMQRAHLETALGAKCAVGLPPTTAHAVLLTEGGVAAWRAAWLPLVQEWSRAESRPRLRALTLLVESGRGQPQVEEFRGLLNDVMALCSEGEQVVLAGLSTLTSLSRRCMLASFLWSGGKGAGSGKGVGGAACDHDVNKDLEALTLWGETSWASFPGLFSVALEDLNAPAPDTANKRNAKNKRKQEAKKKARQA